MKTKEELNALKKEAEILCNKLNELTDDELREVVGGEGSSYDNMFDGCSSLEKAPVLPAQKLEPSCYNGLFEGNGNLRSAHELLPNLTAGGTHNNMFDSGGDLTNAPEFPSPTLE